jgi:peptidyl-prolyl cis-trans isomerase A (cyclophilin A)
MKVHLATLLLTVLGSTAFAATPHVWLDTDQGQVVLELDPVRAPQTTAHFAAVVDSGFLNGTVFHRASQDPAVLQGGWLDTGFRVKVRTPNPTVVSESSNGLANSIGSVALALGASTTGQVLRNSGTTQFYINLAQHDFLNADFTVFGNVVHGMNSVRMMHAGSTTTMPITVPGFSPFNLFDVPRRLPTIRRAVTSDGFPIMNLHTGAWFDPANSGRGFSIEVAHPAGAEQAGPVLVVYWYDFFEGRQVWMTGAAAFAYGASQVTVPLLINEGGEFGPAFDPAQVTSDPDFGSLTIRFASCEQGNFSYQTKYGNGDLQLARLTIPGGNTCQ